MHAVLFCTHGWTWLELYFCAVPVLVLLQLHLFCAAVGPKHRHVDSGVCSCTLNVSCFHRHLVYNLTKRFKSLNTNNNRNTTLTYLNNAVKKFKGSKKCIFCVPVWYLLGDGNGFCIQYIKYSRSQPIPSVFGQPALAKKSIFDPFGWHGDGQLLDEPAALRGGPVMPQLQHGDTIISSSKVRLFCS